MKHELSSMKAFVILAESSSFNNAAKLLNITQPALTRRIKKMEEDLHIQLFERTTRKVTLTKAGKRLLPEARELIKKFDETLFNIRDMNAYPVSYTHLDVYKRQSIYSVISVTGASSWIT